MKWKKEGRSYIGHFFHRSGTFGWIFMEFRFKSLLQKVAELFPVKYSTRRYPAVAKWLYWSNRNKSYGPTTAISLSRGYPCSFPVLLYISLQLPLHFCTQILTLMTWQHFNKRFRTVNISRGVAGRRKPSPEAAKPRVLLLPLSVHTYFRDISIAMVTMSVNVKKNAWMTGG
jgi:hypothetical protein